MAKERQLQYGSCKCCKMKHISLVRNGRENVGVSRTVTNIRQI